MHRNQIDDWKILLNHNAPQIKTNQWLLIKTKVKSTFCRMDYQAFQDLKFYFSDLTSSHSSPAQTTSTTLALLLIEHTNFLALLCLYLWVNTKMVLSMWPLNNARWGHFTLGEQSVQSPECAVSVTFSWTCTDIHSNVCLSPELFLCCIHTDIIFLCVPV